MSRSQGFLQNPFIDQKLNKTKYMMFISRIDVLFDVLFFIGFSEYKIHQTLFGYVSDQQALRPAVSGNYYRYFVEQMIFKLTQSEII